MKGCWAWLPGVLYLFSTPTSAAAEQYSVDWRTSLSCASVARLHEDVAARSDLTPSAGARSPAFHFELSRDEANDVVAKATLPDGSVRHVKAADCNDVIAALAFIVVVTLDPMARGAAWQTAVDSPSNGGAPAATSSKNGQIYAGLSAGMSGGRTPQVMPTGGLFLEAWRSGAWYARGLRLSAVFGRSELGQAPEAVDATLVQGILEGCPLGVSILSVCGGFEGGALYLTSGPALSNTRALRFSMAGRVGGQLRWSWDDVWVGELAAGALLPITLDAFVVRQPDGTLERIHGVNASAYVGLSLGHRL
jgi:hypothetical protein